MGILRISARVILAIGVIGASALAAGFENSGLGVQARGMGGAFRGVANDWTATYYNPAGLAYINDNQWGFDAAFLHYRNELIPDYRFGEIDNAAGFYNGITIYNKHSVLSNPTGGFVGKLPVFGETVMGFTIYQPFDQNISWNLYQIPSAYNDTLFAPDDQYGINLDVVAFQLTAGREITPDKLAIGVGIQLLRADLVYNDLKLRATPMDSTYAPYWHIPEFITSDGNGWGLGFRLGLLYKISAKTNLGLTAALPLNITVKGDARLNFIMPHVKPSFVAKNEVDELFSSGGRVSVTREFETKVKLPASFGLGFAHHPSEKLLVSLDAEYTLWSMFDGLQYSFAEANGLKGPANDPSVKSFFTSDVSTDVEWKNTLKAALGCRLDLYPALSLLGGVSLDQGVNPDKVGFVPQFVDTGTKWGFSGGLLLHIQTWDLGLGGSVITSPDLTVAKTYEDNGSLQSFPGQYKAKTFETIFSIAHRF